MKEEGILSLCMIVKNEEKWLPQCLESIKDVVDEIIIVDTGSTDRTKEIASEYGAVIFDYEWNDSFADARNYGLEQAKGEWILWLDADEQVDPEEREHLRDVLSHPECYFGRIKVVNYYGTYPISYDRSHIMNQYRLFRNDPKLRFTGAIHEQLNIESLDLTASSVLKLPAVLHHHGYLEDAVTEKGKKERNLRLLEKELENEDHDPWLDYHYASELYRNEKLNEAFEQVNLSIGNFLKAQKKPPSLLYKLKYSILMALGSYEGGWPSIELAIKLYPDYVDLHFYKGIILMGMKNFTDAIETFEYCLELDEEHPSYLTMVGTSSFLPWYYIGSCYELMEDLPKAEEAYRKSLELSDSMEQAREALEKLSVSESATDN
ncbi:glycosyltransferase [Paenibacillus sp. P96]|uniref:Glycosyltransferase n=1 Tax=Paenibacillus zeirhizosphaerae TaxID=2987519 RepID=A0ABT9FY34_9BACL|nr:glycosyltransferase [Paenibacillus sp. P96]MDP4099416.1 glycosyltransferase [Paenibacillus sp. P96]